MITMQAIEIVGIVLLLVGFVLVGIEMVVPGFGLPGVAGILCLLAGIFCIADSVEEGILITVIVIVILGILMTVILGLLAHRKLKPPIILDTNVKAESYLNQSDLEYLLHREGVAVTDLRPAGKGNFDGIVFDIYSDGIYIRRGTPIVIDKISENRLIVKKLQKI